jgi:hypothetical protein
MTPSPPFWAGFTVGVSSVAPSLGVNGLVLGVVVRVGYRPTGSSKARKPPSRGHHPKHQEKLGKGGIKT